MIKHGDRKNRSERMILIRRLQQALNKKIELLPDDLHDLELIKMSQELDNFITDLYREYGYHSRK